MPSYGCPAKLRRICDRFLPRSKTLRRAFESRLQQAFAGVTAHGMLGQNLTRSLPDRRFRLIRCDDHPYVQYRKRWRRLVPVSLSTSRRHAGRPAWF
ncbi:hypothetical protein KCP70_08370 [Salmonella enterica subsp. enterica]|nr:hypothetical protein KCP70_08370 [Salmonella enterica subsp. enterica]